MRKNNLKKVVILGLGKSGISAMRLCSRLGIACAGFDEKNIPAFNEENSLSNSSANISLQLWNGKRIPDADIIVTSPGLSLKSEMFKAAISSGMPIVSELEFASYFIDTPILAITGTNGKTTTTELTCCLIKKAGKKAVCAGNIGTPLSDFALCNEKYDFIVTEVSSFQLEHSPSFAPEAAVLLNIESDHMDRYESVDEYAETKFKIFKNIKNPSGAVIRFDLLPYWNRFMNSSQKPVTFSIKASDKGNIYFDSTNKSIHINHVFFAQIDISNAKLKGLHNVENMMAALGLASSVLDRSNISALSEGICEFRGAEHRLEFVAEKDDVVFINDSKATNPDSVRAALRTISGEKKVLLLAGGLDKNMDFSAINDEIFKIKHIFLIGECKKKLFDLFNDKVSCSLFEKFEDAVLAACKNAESGDVVLLSPGCASMDMFRDYRDRGEQFKEIIKRRILI